MEFKKFGDTLISETLTIKNKTNEGNPAKTEFTVCGNNNADVSLIIHRVTLASSDNDFYKQFAYPAKTYKNKTLWQQRTSIRLSTLYEVTDWLNTMIVPNEFKK